MERPTSFSTAARRSYGIAVKDFSYWLSRKLRAENLLAGLELPGQYENPKHERQPLARHGIEHAVTLLVGDSVLLRPMLV